jgi:ABC-type antimicrobial peptide transport system permease subunit
VVSPIRAAIRQLDASLPAGEFTSMREIVHRSLARPRFLAALMSAFGTIALVLGSIGVYSVLSYSFELRSREIAVRIALGASARKVWRLVFADGMRLVGTGLGAGVIAALAVAGALASTLYGVHPRDPVAFVGSAVVLIVAAALACVLPAARAARRDPLRALRGERG